MLHIVPGVLAKTYLHYIKLKLLFGPLLHFSIGQGTAVDR